MQVWSNRVLPCWVNTLFTAAVGRGEEERRRGRGKLYCEYPVILFSWDYIDLKSALGVI
jgi:hypothetical protein